MTGFIRFFVLFLVVSAMASGAFIFDFVKRHDLVLPRTVLANMSLDGMTRKDVRELVKTKLDEFLSEPFQMVARGKVKTVSLKELGVSVNESAIMQSIPFGGEMSNAGIALWSIAGRRIYPQTSIERTEVIRVFEDKFSDIPKSKNAHFGLAGKDMKIVEAQTGILPKIDPLKENIEKAVAFFEHPPLFVELEESKPEIFAADLEKYSQELSQSFPSVLKFTYEKGKWEVDFKKHPEWIIFEKKPHETVDPDLPFSLSWDPVAFAGFVKDNLSPVLEQAPEDARIWRDQDQKVQFEGRAVSGHEISRDRLLTSANDAIANKIDEVQIPVSVVPPKVDVSDGLQELGIHELIGVGYTRFAGSPENRRHNIQVGISKFNGLLVPTGEQFSFNENVGPVDDTTGFKKELVIKPEGTVPEFGGGLCQVSSTMFRAIVNAGLPIIARSPHSYVVSYYAQVGGHGLDATVYPPTVDLKFLNDTPGYILIQSYTDGDAAYFKFYGTSDGRKVGMEGPFISNRTTAPAEPLLVPDKKLQPGEKKQVEKAHNGFDVLWYRYITNNGTTTKEKIFSRYKAVPNKFLVGGDITPSPAGSSTPAVNPFE